MIANFTFIQIFVKIEFTSTEKSHLYAWLYLQEIFDRGEQDTGLNCLNFSFITMINLRYHTIKGAEA